MTSASGPLQAALAAHKAGRLDEAARLYDNLLATDPKNPDALNLSGMLRLQRGDAAAAEARIAQAVAARPREALYHANLAKAKQVRGDAAGALACLRQAAKLAPDQSGFCQQLALALRAAGDIAAAVGMLRKAARAAPRDIAPLNNLAALFLEQGQVTDACAAIARALALDPDNAHALANQGQAFLLEDQAAAALEPLRRAAAADPSNVVTLNSLGVALNETGATEESLAVLRRALERAAHSPMIHVSLGNALKRAGQYDAALASFERALALKPGVAEVHSHIGTCYEAQMRYGAAIVAYDEALRLKPDYRRARHNRSMALLTSAAFEDGWRDYAARDFRADLAPHVSNEPLSPSDIEGRSFLLLGEQGLGDEIFFLRFHAPLRARGAARIAAEVSGKIHGLMSRVAGFEAVTTNRGQRPVVDRTVVAGDLPRLLGMRSAAEIPPTLRVAPLPERAVEMVERLAALGPPPYIGVTWRAGTADRLGALFKLAPLEDIGRALAGLPGTLLALQRLPEPGEIDGLAAAAGKPVHDLTALNDDLEGMLALLAALDDYVCVSNTNVHLRAMVGRSCRVLIPAPPDFRWMAPSVDFAADESPWFPGMPLYRQSADRDWSAPLATLKRDLAKVFS